MKKKKFSPYDPLIKSMREKAINDELAFRQADDWTFDKAHQLLDEGYAQGSPASSGGTPYDPNYLRKPFLEQANPLLDDLNKKAHNSNAVWSSIRGYSNMHSNPNGLGQPIEEAILELLKMEPRP